MKTSILVFGLTLFAFAAWFADVLFPRITSWCRRRALALASRPDPTMIQALIDLLVIEATFEAEIRGASVELHIVRFDCGARDSEILRAFEAHALRRGTPEELRVLASEHADALPTPLVAFASDGESDDRDDSFVSLDDTEKGVSSTAWKDGAGRWHGHCRFLAANWSTVS